MAAPAAPKPVKSPKKTAKKAASDHPSYDVMIIQAVKALNEKKGSSRQAIVKHIRSNHNLPDKADVRIKLALKRMEKKGTLTHTTGSGAAGSFLVADSKKTAKKPTKPKPKKVKKPAAAKKSAKSKTAKSPTKTKPKKEAAAKKAKKPAQAKASEAPSSKKTAAPAKGKKASVKKSKSSKKGKKSSKK